MAESRLGLVGVFLILACAKQPAPAPVPEPTPSVPQEAEPPGLDEQSERAGDDEDASPEPSKPPPGMVLIEAGGPAVVILTEEYVEHSFYYDIYEATVAEYRACIEAGACTPSHSAKWNTPECTGDKPDKDDFPINCIDGYQARAFCEWQGKRLPTRIEWAWAAQGPEGRTYPWGDEPPPSCERANYAAEPRGCGHGGPWPVGSHPLGATPQGQHDLLGNVAEWTSTPHKESGKGGISAGMSWRSKTRPRVLQTAFGLGLLESWSDQIGVRCAKDVFEQK